MLNIELKFGRFPVPEVMIDFLMVGIVIARCIIKVVLGIIDAFP